MLFMKGKLIVIEGTDCSGKETQTLLLEKKLNELNIKTKHLSFPMYDTPTGCIIATCYLGKEEYCVRSGATRLARLRSPILCAPAGPLPSRETAP